jgi:protein ImuA
MSAAANADLLPALRARIAAIGADGAARALAAAPARVALGHGGADAALAGGLAPGALHEVHAQEPGDAPAAARVAQGSMARLPGGPPGRWGRP